jgi:hypothetical protein
MEKEQPDQVASLLITTTFFWYLSVGSELLFFKRISWQQQVVLAAGRNEDRDDLDIETRTKSIVAYW